MASSVKMKNNQVDELRQCKICQPRRWEIRFADWLLPQENGLSRPDVVTGLATCGAHSATFMVASLHHTVVCNHTCNRNHDAERMLG